MLYLIIHSQMTLQEDMSKLLISYVSADGLASLVAGTSADIVMTRLGPRITTCRFNSLAPGRHRCHFKIAIFNLVLLIGIFTSSKDNALRWMPRDLVDDKSILVQVMDLCRQATSRYLSQCWPYSMSPYGVTRPQSVNALRLEHFSRDI